MQDLEIYNDELQEGFRVFEYESQGNETIFKHLLDEIKDKKKATYSKLQIVKQQIEQSIETDEILQTEVTPQIIETEEMTTIQLNNVIEQMQRKLIDKQLIIDKQRETLRLIQKDEISAFSEQQHSQQMLFESRNKQLIVNKYSELLQITQDQKKLELKEKYKKNLEQVKQLQNNYAEFKQQEKELNIIISQQQDSIRLLDEHRNDILNIYSEQKTVVYYANTLQLLESMICQDDPYNLYNYEFDRKVDIATKQRDSNNFDFFALTDLQSKQEEQDDQNETDNDQYLFKLITKDQENFKEALNNFNISPELLTFTDTVLQQYQQFQIQFQKLQFQFVSLNERKHECKETLKSLVYQKYPETSNGLMSEKLCNIPQTTLNIMATSVESNLDLQKIIQNVKITQKTVLRLHHFIRNHIVRVNNLILNINAISVALPKDLLKLADDLKTGFLINETIKTPSRPRNSLMTNSINHPSSVVKDFLQFKHVKVIPSKSMTSTVYVPRKSKINLGGYFRFEGIVQQFLKTLLSDEVERLFVCQEMIEDFLSEVNRLAKNVEPDEENLMKILQNQQFVFKLEIRSKTIKIISTTFQKLGVVINKIKEQILLLKQKGISVEQIKFKPGTCLSFENLKHISTAYQNACKSQTNFNSQATSFDNLSRPTLANATESQKSGRDIFHFLRKLTKPLDQGTNQNIDEDSDDSFDVQRSKVKQNNYYIRQSIVKQKDQSEIEDVFSRLHPPRNHSINKNYSQQISALKSIRMNAKSSIVAENDLKISIWKMKSPWEKIPKQGQKETFRNLFNSSEKKPIKSGKSQTASQSFHPGRNYKEKSDDVEKVWKKKFRAKRVINARNLVQPTDVKSFAFLEQI